MNAHTQGQAHKQATFNVHFSSNDMLQFIQRELRHRRFYWPTLRINLSLRRSVPYEESDPSRFKYAPLTRHVTDEKTRNSAER